MQQFHDLYNHILKNGSYKKDRTGVGTYSVFGYSMRFDLNEGFPLVTSKKVNFRPIKEELLWFLRGQTNINNLNAQIWNEWANDDGDLGPIYGKQWRSWSVSASATTQAYVDATIEKLEDMLEDITMSGGDADLNSEQVEQMQNAFTDLRDINHGGGGSVDQIQDVIDTIKRDPDSRRMVVSAWNPAQLPASGIKPHEQPELGRMALAPCHCLFQFFVADGRLSCMMTQRSLDAFIGGPFNVASYALLTHLIAEICDLDVGEFIWSIGDGHLYNNHLDEVNEFLSRKPTSLPTLRLTGSFTDIDSITSDQIKIEGYHPHPAIKADIAV